MKINMILAIDHISGGALVALKYLEFFAKRGEDVICYIPSTGYHFGWRKIAMIKSFVMWHMHGEWRQRLGNFKVRYEFPVVINNFTIRDADITIATAWITAYWVNKLNVHKGKHVYLIQGYETWGNKRENDLVEKSYELPFDLRITVSTALHDKIFRLHNSESKIILNGIDQTFISEQDKFFNVKNLTVGFPYREDSKKTIVKNCKLGLEVLQILIHKHSEVRAVSFGFSKPVDWPENIEYCINPSRNELKELYDKIDIFYVPSIYEGWGLPAMEAMARGCVVVASDSGFIHEYGEDMVNCKFLSNPNNAKQTLSEIESLMVDSNILSMLSKNGLQTIKYVTFERFANCFYECLHELELDKIQ